MRIILVLVATLFSGFAVAGNTSEKTSWLPLKETRLLMRVAELERQVEALLSEVQTLQAEAHQRYEDDEARTAVDPFDVLGAAWTYTDDSLRQTSAQRD